MKFAHLLRSSHASKLLALFLTSLPALMLAGWGDEPKLRVEKTFNGFGQPLLVVTSLDEREFTINKIVINKRCEIPGDGKPVGDDDYTECQRAAEASQRAAERAAEASQRALETSEEWKQKQQAYEKCLQARQNCGRDIEVQRSRQCWNEQIALCRWYQEKEREKEGGFLDGNPNPLIGMEKSRIKELTSQSRDELCKLHKTCGEMGNPDYCGNIAPIAGCRPPTVPTAPTAPTAPQFSFKSSDACVKRKASVFRMGEGYTLPVLSCGDVITAEVYTSIGEANFQWK